MHSTGWFAVLQSHRSSPPPSGTEATTYNWIAIDKIEKRRRFQSNHWESIDQSKLIGNAFGGFLRWPNWRRMIITHRQWRRWWLITIRNVITMWVRARQLFGVNKLMVAACLAVETCLPSNWWRGGTAERSTVGGGWVDQFNWRFIGIKRAQSMSFQLKFPENQIKISNFNKIRLNLDEPVVSLAF